MILKLSNRYYPLSSEMTWKHLHHIRHQTKSVQNWGYLEIFSQWDSLELLQEFSDPTLGTFLLTQFKNSHKDLLCVFTSLLFTSSLILERSRKRSSHENIGPKLTMKKAAFWKPSDSLKQQICMNVTKKMKMPLTTKSNHSKMY